MNIQEIKLTKFPLVIITDSHTNLKNIDFVRAAHPDSQVICLGDITFLFSKPGETRNQESINYFIENKIPCLKGNHESHVLQCSIGDSFTKIMPKYSEDCSSSICDADIYNLTQQQIDFLRKLPTGFKIILPNGFNYYCFHNEPNDLWNFPDKITKEYFIEKYVFNSLTLGVIQGHLHKNQVDVFQGLGTKRYIIGQLCNSNHHTGVNNGKNYGLLTEDGIEFKKL